MAVIMYLDLREKVNSKNTNFEYTCKDLIMIRALVDCCNCFSYDELE